MQAIVRNQRRPVLPPPDVRGISRREELAQRCREPHSLACSRSELTRRRSGEFEEYRLTEKFFEHIGTGRTKWPRIKVALDDLFNLDLRE